VLKNLLEDPAARAELLQAASASRPAKRSLWLWWLAPVSMALIVSVVAVRFYVDKPAPVITAQIRTPAAPPPAVEAPAQVQQAPAEAPHATPVKAARQAGASADKEARKDVSPPAALSLEPPAAPARVVAPAGASVSQSVEVGASAALIETSPANRMADENRPMKSLAMAKKKAEEVDSLSLQYTLLKQSATGEFEPVANDAVFSKSDVIRVKVQSAAAGTITVIQGSKVVASEGASAAGDHILPRQGGISLSAGTTLELSIQQPPGGITQAFTARSGAASDAVGGTRRIVIRLKTE